MILIIILTFFHVEKSYSGYINWFLSYIQKCMKKLRKTGFTRNALISKSTKIFGSNLIWQFLNRYPRCIEIANLYRLNWLRVNVSKRVKAGSGCAGSGRLITDIDYMCKKKKNCSIDHIESIKLFPRYHVVWKSHMTVERSSFASLLRVSRNKSDKTNFRISWMFWVMLKVRARII